MARREVGLKPWGWMEMGVGWSLGVGEGREGGMGGDEREREGGNRDAKTLTQISAGHS